MKIHTPRHLAVSCLTALALTACGEGSTAPAPTDDVLLDRDVVQMAASATFDDLEQMRLAGGGAGDAAQRSDGVVRERTITFFDAAGAEMDAFDPLLTASAHLVIHIEGTREGPDRSTTIDRDREMTVTGMEGEETERTWNGAGTEERSRTRIDDEDGTRTYTKDETSTVEDVVVVVPRSEHPYPLSGTITRHIVVTRSDRDGTRERTVVIVFDGDSTATATVNGRTFEIDLSDRDARPRRRGR